MFLRNYWYVAAFSHEVEQEPLTRTLLNQQVVLYRTRRGDVAALEDCCAHRLMPLSKGKIVDDAIVCCYHGLAFNPAGACVHVPRMETPPSGLNVRSYPAVERYGSIWLWFGDPRLADESHIFD